jgi:hypothetical protein
MKTKNTIRTGMLTLLVAIFSTAMLGNTVSEKANAEASNHDEHAIVITMDLALTGSSLGGDEFYNLPDPFQVKTELIYVLSKDTEVVLSVYKNHQLIAVLVSEKQQRGTHSVAFESQPGATSGGQFLAVLETEYGFQTEWMTQKVAPVITKQDPGSIK